MQIGHNDRIDRPFYLIDPFWKNQKQTLAKSPIEILEQASGGPAPGAGIKQEELAGKIGVSVIHVGRYEGDESQPTLDVLKRMAKVLGVSLDYLVFDEKEGVAAARLRDQELLERFEKLMYLSDEHKQTVSHVIAGLVVKNQLSPMMTPQPEAKRPV